MGLPAVVFRPHGGRRYTGGFPRRDLWRSHSARVPVLLGPVPIDWHVAGCWAALIAFGWMFGLNSWALTSATDQQLESLKGSASEVAELVRTMPPKFFLGRCEEFLFDCFPTTLKAESSAHPEDTVRAIIALLSAFAFLAELFYKGPPPQIICANIMLFRDSSKLTNEEKHRIAERARFRERKVASGCDWRGVLRLEPQLAVALRNKKITQQTNVPIDSVLEVPDVGDYSVDGKSALLPGAPEAFCPRTPSYSSDNTSDGQGVPTRASIQTQRLPATRSVFQEWRRYRRPQLDLHRHRSRRPRLCVGQMPLGEYVPSRCTNGPCAAQRQARPVHR